MAQTLPKSKAILIVITVITLFCTRAYCPEPENRTAAGKRLSHEVSLIAGFGSSNIPEGNYQPVLLAGHFGINLKRYFAKLENHRGNLKSNLVLRETRRDFCIMHSSRHTGGGRYPDVIPAPDRGIRGQAAAGNQSFYYWIPCPASLARNDSKSNYDIVSGGWGMFMKGINKEGLQ